MRELFFDTETTGLDPINGDKIVEIGVVEVVNKKLTGLNFHSFCNPERDIPEQSSAIHGIDNEKVQHAPIFSDIADKLLQFLEGADALIAHNAEFDIKFINSELKHASKDLDKKFPEINLSFKIIDTLTLARKKFPGQKNSLDKLCQRFKIDLSTRKKEGHGAILDSELLVRVYAELTKEQTSFGLKDQEAPKENTLNSTGFLQMPIPELSIAKQKVIQATGSEISSHKEIVSKLKS